MWHAVTTSCRDIKQNLPEYQLYAYKDHLYSIFRTYYSVWYVIATQQIFIKSVQTYKKPKHIFCARHPVLRSGNRSTDNSDLNNFFICIVLTFYWGDTQSKQNIWCVRWSSVL